MRRDPISKVVTWRGFDGVNVMTTMVTGWKLIEVLLIPLTLQEAQIPSLRPTATMCLDSQSVSVEYQVAATKGKYFDCIGFMRHGGFLVGPIKHYPDPFDIRYDSVSPDSYHLPHPADTLLSKNPLPWSNASQG